MTASKGQVSIEAAPHGVGVRCPFAQVDSPGLYVEHKTGSLVRVPEDALAPGRSPLLEIMSNEPWVVTKISGDPFLPLTKARMLASNLDLYVNF